MFAWPPSDPANMQTATGLRAKDHLHVSLSRAAPVDTYVTVMVFETSLDPRLYMDPSLVRTDLLRKSDTSSYCTYKGVATYWSAVLDDLFVEDVARSYEDPFPESLPIKGFLSFDDTRVDVVAELPERQPFRTATGH